MLKCTKIGDNHGSQSFKLKTVLSSDVVDNFEKREIWDFGLNEISKRNGRNGFDGFEMQKHSEKNNVYTNGVSVVKSILSPHIVISYLHVFTYKNNCNNFPNAHFSEFEFQLLIGSYSIDLFTRSAHK